MDEYLQYLRVKIQRSVSEAQHTWIGDRAGIVRTIVVSIPTSIAVNFLRVPLGIVTTNPWVVIGTSFVGLLIGIVIWLVLLFLWKFFIESPVKIWVELRSEAFKYTWKDFDFYPYRFPENSMFGVGLKADNHKPYYIQEAEAKLIHIQRGKEKLNWELPRNLVWIAKDGKSRTKAIKIDPRQSRLLAIADWNVDSVWLEYEVADNAPRLDKGITYTLEIEFYGQVDGHVMDIRRVEYVLTWSFDKEGKIQVEMKESKSIIRTE
jgi:hypothetical protein